MPTSPRTPFRRRPALLPAALLAALLATLPAMPGCGGGSEADQLASARKHLAQHEAEAARIELKTLLQKNPQSGEARFLLGKLMADSGDAAGAEAELRRALEAGYAEAAVLPPLAGAMLAQGKGKLMLLQFGKTSLADPQADAELKTLLATAEAADGDRQAAEALVAEVLARHPDHTGAVLLDARLTEARGDAAGATQRVEALLARAPDNVAAWMFKGDLAMQRARAAGSAPDDALAAYGQALKLRPDHLGAHSAVITLLIGRQDFAAANQAWAAMKKALPNQPQTLFFEALLADQRGDAARTREITQQLLRGAPDNPRLLLLAGQTELKLGALAQAEALLGKAVQVAPQAAPARRLLAETQLRGGQADKALSTLRPLLDASPPDADALSLSARALLVKGDGKGAEAALARAAQLKPGDTRLRTAVALSQLGKGQDTQALAELQTIAASDKGIRADLALVSARLARNDVPGALKAVDALAAKTPQDPLPDMLRGRIALRGRDAAGARKHFEAALAKSADYLPALSGLAALDLQAGQAPAARARFEAVLQRNPNHVGALLALAEISDRSGGKPADSQALLERAVKADPADAAARMLLVDHLLAAKQPKPALSAAQAAVSALPDNPELLDRLGRAQLATGDSQQAVTSFTKLAALQPRSPLPQLRLADAQAAAGNRTGLAAAVMRAQELAPDSPPVQAAAITLALMDNKPEAALAVARKVQSQHPAEATGWLMEGEIALRGQHFDAAAAAYRKALDKTGPADAAQRLHAALLGAKKGDEAERFAADWRRRHADDLGFVQYLGDAAMGAGRLPQAEALYREVLAKQPQQPVALNNLAYVLAAQGKPGGVAVAEQALKQAPEAPALLDTLAFALAAEQQLPRALEVQARAVALAPDAPAFRLQLARLQLKAGQKAAARTELEALAKLGTAFNRQAEVAELLKQAAGG